ncbi:hypothetical protein C8Q74DRAFT_1214889 [Fomes fomentarius]|nr:hypothetical protein C8Q74DRAFT_1214889 [Fomes fomentarius]
MFAAAHINPTGKQAIGLTSGVDLNNKASSLESELYLKTAQLDKAEDYLKKALSVREHAGPKADLAVTRDNLGRLFEMKGELGTATEMRLRGAPDNIACGNYNVADWKRHKKYCRAQGEGTPQA